MAANDLILYRRTEELLYGIYPRLINFPKAEKFSLCQSIKDNIFNITHRLLRSDSKKRIKRKAKKMKRLIVEGKIAKEKAEQILNSWKGHAEHGCSYNFIRRLIAGNDYIYLDAKGRLRIDMSKITDRSEENAY